MCWLTTLSSLSLVQLKMIFVAFNPIFFFTAEGHFSLFAHEQLTLMAFLNTFCQSRKRWSRCSRGLRHGAKAARLLGLWVRIPSQAWLSLSLTRGCCVLSGRSLYVGPITCPEESYWGWCLSVISRPLQWEGLGPLWLWNHEKKKHKKEACDKLKSFNLRLLIILMAHVTDGN